MNKLRFVDKMFFGAYGSSMLILVVAHFVLNGIGSAIQIKNILALICVYVVVPLNLKVWNTVYVKNKQKHIG